MPRRWCSRAGLSLALALVACGKRDRAVPRDAAHVIRDAAATADAAPVREVVILRQVDLNIVAPQGEHRPDREALIARLRQLGGGVVGTQDGVPPGQAGRGGLLRAVLTYDRNAQSVLMTIEVAIDLDGDAMGIAARAAGEQALGRDREAGVVDALATRLVDEVAAELRRKLDLRAAPPEALVAAGKGADPELAAWALELAGERKDRALRPVAVASLARPGTRQRTAAVQYLVALGDPTAVHDLTSAVDFSDPDQLAAIIEAATALGGEDARAFLEMLANGSSDPAISDKAKDGLKRLDKKEDANPD